MSKLWYTGAFLLLLAVVLVSCSSFEVDLHEVEKKEFSFQEHTPSHNHNHNHRKGGSSKKHHHHNHRHPEDEEREHRRFKNKNTEFFDADFNPKPDAIKQRLFGDKAHLFNQQQTDALLNSSKTTPVGIALTFAPSFFANLFNIIVLPQIQQIADNINIPNHNFGISGPGGQGSITGVKVRNFDIKFGQLQPVAPSTFNWALKDISISITGGWSVKWQIKMCPCFGHCCFHITLFHCSGPFSVTADNIGISGTMNFALNTQTDTVEVQSPSGANWQGAPQIGLNVHCGWFLDALISILKVFGLNVWKMVQDAINAAITKAFQGGALGAATNKILDDTVNAAFNGIHICGFQFYEGQNFMSIFTHETSDPSSPCLKNILPPPWLQTPPKNDITLLARIDTFPAFLPATSWKMICLPLPQQWFALPGGLGDLMKVAAVTTCVGLDNSLGIYLVGEIDVTFFATGSEYELRRRALPYIQEANKAIAADFARDEAKLQHEVDVISGEGVHSGSCPFKSGMGKMISRGEEGSAPWWTCANIPLLEVILSALPGVSIGLIALVATYFIFFKKSQLSPLVENNNKKKTVSQISNDEEGEPLKEIF